MRLREQSRLGRGVDIIDFEDNEERNDWIYDSLDGTPDRFIKYIANQHYDTLRNCEGLTYTDLIQEGWIGLIEAAEKYDDTRKVKFSTYAYYWVQKYILGALDKEIKTSIAEAKYNYKGRKKSIAREALTLHKMEQLSEQEQEILELHAEGYTQEEISEKASFKISQQHISRKLDNIKSMCKNAPNSV